MNERTETLIEQWVLGVISPDDFAELERRLQTDPAARRALRRAANLDHALRDWASRDERTAAWLQPAEPRWQWRTMGWLAAAAVVCFGVFFVAGRRTAAPSVAVEELANGAAVLTQSVDAHWEGAAGHDRLGDTLGPGPRVLRSGWAQIEFFSGAALVVAGPAEFEIVSPWEVTWRHGKARVRVPPAARGFRLMTPGMKLVDLGTEFGVDVDRATSGSSVQVFSGEVEAHPAAGGLVSLTEGQGLEQRGGAVMRVSALRPEDFPSGDDLRTLGRARAESRFEQWQQFSQRQRSDARLLAYYAMEQVNPGERLVRNAAEPREALRDGGAVGAAWAAGRWPQKSALEFKRPGDRVRLQLEGTYEAITLACWVRIDGLDRRYNGLLLTDGYEPGEPHWQIYEDGRLMFSVMYHHPDHPAQRRNQIYFSPVVFNGANTGRWHHLAVVYDARSGAAVQYFDGAEVSREVSPFHVAGRPLSFGPSELGNWGLPTTGHQFPIRNLNGRLDEFAIYSSALSGDEIRAMYEAGTPE